MEIFLIPLANTPQRFEIALGDTEYTVQCRWNPAADSWIVDMWRADNGASIFCNLPLVTGVDLLAQYRHLVQGSLHIYTDGDENATPTMDNLGKESNLYYITEGGNG